MTLPKTPQPLATFGTSVPAEPRRRLSAGTVSLVLAGGDVADLRVGGVEVVRRISHPIRDESWGTLPLVARGEELRTDADGLVYERGFATGDGALEGRFRLAVTGGTPAVVVAEVTIEATRETRVNRAGFTLLHPLEGVAGEPVRVTHPDGGVEETAFPSRISAGQPAMDIAGLSHTVRGVRVAIAFSGEVFEMEDQRNWSDASFKTYCRPLSEPRPYTLAPGAPVTQRITIALSGEPAERAAAPAAETGRVPEIALASEPGLSDAARLPGLDGLPVQLRIPADADAPALAPYRGCDVALEIVLPAGAAPDFTPLARACAEAGVAPSQVAALPEGYLASHQPEGPWPPGPRPADLIAPLRAAFPQAAVGTGVFTNFTELNRCPPDAAAADYVTFGSTAIVHAADDASVVETLEALPQILDSAAALAGGKPLRLGLVSIGMRSNPYGAAVAPNPEGGRVPMAMADPRQRGLFAAAWAVGVLAAAAGRAQSLALAMAEGPLGLVEEGRVRPLFHLVRAAHALSGEPVAVLRKGGLVSLRTADGRGLAANLGETPAVLDADARILDADAFDEAGADPLWLDRAGSPGRTLAPFAVAFLGSRS